MKRSTFIRFIFPSCLVLAITVIYPLSNSIWASLHAFRLGGGVMKFVGVSNYLSVISHRGFWESLGNTAYFTAFTLLLQFVLGFGIALLLNQIGIAQKLFSVLIYIPLVITPAAAGLFIKWMLVSDWGIVNYLLGSFRLPTPDWLGDSRFAIWSIIIADTWEYTPFVTLILLAGLRNLPAAPIEAARIDGASGLRILWHIILPGLKPIILFVLVIRSTNAVRVFDKVYVMTGGGPGNSTETLLHYNYRVAFGELEIGKAAAISVWALIFLMMLAGILIQLLFERKARV